MFFFGGSLATRELSKKRVLFFSFFYHSFYVYRTRVFLPVARDVNSLTDPSHSRRQRTTGNFGF